jgi:hypothetical protein
MLEFLVRTEELRVKRRFASCPLGSTSCPFWYLKMVWTELNIEITIVWEMTPCILVEEYKRFGRTHCLHLQNDEVFYSEHGRSRLHRNVRPYLPLHGITSRKTRTDINNPNVIRSRELSVRAIHRAHGTVKARRQGTGQSIWNLWWTQRQRLITLWVPQFPSVHYHFTNYIHSSTIASWDVRYATPRAHYQNLWLQLGLSTLKRDFTEFKAKFLSLVSLLYHYDVTTMYVVNPSCSVAPLIRLRAAIKTGYSFFNSIKSTCLLIYLVSAGCLLRDVLAFSQPFVLKKQKGHRIIGHKHSVFRNFLHRSFFKWGGT